MGANKANKAPRHPVWLNRRFFSRFKLAPMGFCSAFSHANRARYCLVKLRVIPQGGMKAARSVNHRGLPVGGGLGYACGGPSSFMGRVEWEYVRGRCAISGFLSKFRWLWKRGLLANWRAH